MNGSRKRILNMNTAVALETAKASIVKATVTLVRHFDS